MSNSRRELPPSIRAWWPVVAGVAVIVLESTEMLGSNHTSGLLRHLYQTCFGAVDDTRWEMIHHYIRKCGHFCGYGLLGLLWLRAWRITLPSIRIVACAALALLGTAVVASCDEFHQSLLPNRTGSPRDVLLDCCGAAVMIAIACLGMRFFGRGIRHETR